METIATRRSGYAEVVISAEGRPQDRIRNRIWDGGGAPVLLAEIGQAHTGSLDVALQMVNAVATSGFDGVKVQVHDPDTESSREEAFRPESGEVGESRLEYWRRTMFSEEEWRQVAAQARNRGLFFVPSCFSESALEISNSLSPDAWKVGSGEALQPWYLSLLRRKEEPVLLSTGMSNTQEIAKGVQQLESQGNSVVIVQSTSRYPSEPAMIGLSNISLWREQFGVPTGLSDHSGSILPALGALFFGARVVEVHVTFSRSDGGLDADASITFEEASSLAKFRDSIHQMMTSEVPKDAVTETLTDMRTLFGRSVGLRVGAQPGQILREADLLPRKPGTGIPWTEVARVIGRRLNKTVASEELLHWGDFS